MQAQFHPDPVFRQSGPSVSPGWYAEHEGMVSGPYLERQQAESALRLLQDCEEALREHH